MLKIVEGGFNSGISEQLSREILKRTENKLRTLLIVPEQQTVTAEAEMCELLSPSAPLFFEATNFTRLANSVFRALGGVAGEYCTKDVKSLVMWRTLTELSPVLTMTAARAEISSGLIERALSAVMLAENHGIGAVELTDVLENENVSSNARLKSKVNDLALITALYKKLLSEKYQDAKDDLAQAAEALIKAPDFLSDTEIYVDGFTSFTEPQYKLLSVLMQRTSLTVALNIPKSEASSFEFAELRRTRDKLISVADKASSEKKLLRLDGAFSVKSELLAEAERLLWRTDDCRGSGGIHAGAWDPAGNEGGYRQACLLS